MIFDASDLKKHTTWKRFLKMGYVVRPAEKPALRQKPACRWFAEGRKKDVPEPHPILSEYRETTGHGLQPPSGKIEFVSSSLARFRQDPERPALNRHIPSREGRQTAEVMAGTIWWPGSTGRCREARHQAPRSDPAVP